MPTHPRKDAIVPASPAPVAFLVHPQTRASQTHTVNVPAYVPARRAVGTRDGSLLDQALTRAAGTPLVAGNSVRLLRNATQNYPAWLDAIHAATRTIRFENYFIVDDEIGREFAAALCAKARAGVDVKLIYDWMGGFGKASRRFWNNLRTAGVNVRCFNPPHLSSPFGWLHRDHRKVLVVDSQVGFITGLCVGQMWVGDPQRKLEPWRDTGVQIHGPALRDVEHAFQQVWTSIGGPLPDAEALSIATSADMASRGPDDNLGTTQNPRETYADAQTSTSSPNSATARANAPPPDALENVSMRIVANAPGTASLLRLDQIIAGAARNTLWLTDAYFAGIPPYVQALRAAALDGVDVRLLVPGGYRPLLEAGVRVFEWKGTMLHAKTAVADGRWARVGSSNLNIASWVGNYELDAVIENEPFAAAMEQMYEEDILNSTEIVLRARRWRMGRTVRTEGNRPRVPRNMIGLSGRGGSASRAAAGALRIGRTVGAALTEQRVLAATEGKIVAIAGVVLLLFAAAIVVWPLLIAGPIAILCIWFALALMTKARVLWRERRRPEGADSNTS
jgi:cardiolipin synthase